MSFEQKEHARAQAIAWTFWKTPRGSRILVARLLELCGSRSSSRKRASSSRLVHRLPVRGELLLPGQDVGQNAGS